jgi:hypothetical protein
MYGSLSSGTHRYASAVCFSPNPDTCASLRILPKVREPSRRHESQLLLEELGQDARDLGRLSQKQGETPARTQF